MAVAEAVKPPLRASSPSWNPLRCGGTALPINLLVMAKAIAIALLLTQHVKLLPDPFLPFVPGLDRIPPLAFQRTIQALFLISACTLLLNRAVRFSCFVLGMTMILGVVASKAYYGNNKTFCGFILFLTSLYEPRKGPWLIRLQLVVVYFGAGLNKLLDGDWRSGVFFQNWAGNRLHQPVYTALASWAPPMLVAKLASWFTIAAELGLSAVLLARPLFPIGIWLSILLHSGMLLFTGSTFTMFFYAMTASMLAFVEWPVAPLLVIFDGNCGFCRNCKRWMERFDLDGMFAWRPYQSGAGERFGISDMDASRRFYLVNGEKIYSGFRALRMMILFNPLSYLVTYALLALPGAGDSRFRNVLVTVLLLLFSPFFTPIGEALYGFVARHRRILSSSSECAR